MGVVYVARVSDPATLLAGALSVLGAGGVAVQVLIGPARRTLWVSTGLSLLVIPFSLFLAGYGHGSAGVLGGAAAAALAIAIYSLARWTGPASDSTITPDRPEDGDQDVG